MSTIYRGFAVHFFILSVMSIETDEKQTHSLMYLIAWAATWPSLQTLLLHSLIPFIIVVLKLHSIIVFLGAVVSYDTALPFINLCI